MKRIMLGMTLLVAFAFVGTGFAKNMFSHRFIRVCVNAGSDQNMADSKKILDRAAKVGYNGYFFDDSKTPAVLTLAQKTLDRMTDICQYARSKGMVAMPMHFGQVSPTYNEIIHAEGFPVAGTPFVVSGNTATVKSDHGAELKNGGFEGSTGWKLFGSGVSIGAGKTGKGLFFNNPNKTLVEQVVNVKKHRAYKLTVWVKTENCGKPDMIAVDVYDRAKKYYLLKRVYGSFSTWDDLWGTRVAKTQAWREYTIDFHSLQSEAVNIWVRANQVSKSNTGKVWIDEIKLEETGLFETVRRSTTPVTVKSEDGSKTFEEGKDFVVGDQKLTIPGGSAIKSGDKLRVDWYQRGDMIDARPGASFCHGEVWKHLWKQAEKCKQVFGTDGMWVKYSEWRTAFWDKNCHKQYNNSVQQYQGGVQWRTNDMLRHIYGNCNLPVFLWSDTYDPYHNSSKNIYYQVNGAPYGNWNYLDPKTIIVNWNVHHRVNSFLFFGGVDKQHPSKMYRQLLNVFLGTTSYLTLLAEAESKGLPDGAVIGVNYCTWGESYYGGIEPFAAAAKKTGRWLTGPVPKDPVTTDCKLVLPDTAGNGVILPEIAGRGQSISNAKGIRLSHAVGENSVRIKYSLPQNGAVRLTVHNMLGQETMTIAKGQAKAGNHEVSLDRSRMPAGVYFMSLTHDEMESRVTKKVILM